MSVSASEVRSLLKNVELEGVAVLQKRKLLWLLGWKNDKAAAWKDLLDHWVEIGGRREDLWALEIADKVVLTLPITRDGGAHQMVMGWAQEAPRQV